MQDYKSSTYLVIANLFGIFGFLGSWITIYNFTENLLASLLPALFIGTFLYLSFKWFAMVLYGLEENGNLLKKISDNYMGNIENKNNSENLTNNLTEEEITSNISSSKLLNDENRLILIFSISLLLVLIVIFIFS